jgi:hypothetical protein
MKGRQLLVLIFPTSLGVAQIRALILQQLSFGVITIIEIIPDEVQVDDIVMELMHSGCWIRAQVWVKMRHGARGWPSIAKFRRQYDFISYLA